MDINEKIGFSIDWLTETFDFIQFDDAKSPYGSITRNKYEEGRKKLNEFYSLLTYSNFDERTEEKKKFKDYKERVYLGEFIQLFLSGCKNGRGLKHSKIEIPGNGCRDFINRGGNWFELLKFCNQENVLSFNPTRIDAAIDIRTTKYFTFDLLVEWLFDKGLYSSPMRDITHISSKRRLANQFYKKGNTLYIGSESSAVYLCIYDKKLERIQAGDETPMTDECWYRIEMRFRDEQATWFIENFLETVDRGDYSFIMDALYKVLDIKNDEQKTKAMRNRYTVQWWKDFLHDASKAKFNDRVLNPITLARKKKYIEVNSGPSLALMYYAFDSKEDYIKWILSIVEDHSEDLENIDIEIINKLRDEKGSRIINNDDLDDRIKELKGTLYNNDK